MGHLRSAARALAGQVDTPADLVPPSSGAGVSSGSTASPPGSSAASTPGRAICSMASAGHYPPLLVESAGAIPPGGPRRPFGVAGGPRARVAGPLVRGQALLLYTDGAVDERGIGPEASMGQCWPSRRRSATPRGRALRTARPGPPRRPGRRRRPRWPCRSIPATTSADVTAGHDKHQRLDRALAPAAGVDAGPVHRLVGQQLGAIAKRSRSPSRSSGSDARPPSGLTPAGEHRPEDEREHGQPPTMPYPGGAAARGEQEQAGQSTGHANWPANRPAPSQVCPTPVADAPTTSGHVAPNRGSGPAGGQCRPRPRGRHPRPTSQATRPPSRPQAGERRGGRAGRDGATPTARLTSRRSNHRRSRSANATGSRWPTSTDGSLRTRPPGLDEPPDEVDVLAVAERLVEAVAERGPPATSRRPWHVRQRVPGATGPGRSPRSSGEPIVDTPSGTMQHVPRRRADRRSARPPGPPSPQRGQAVAVDERDELAGDERQRGVAGGRRTAGERPPGPTTASRGGRSSAIAAGSIEPSSTTTTR